LPSLSQRVQIVQNVVLYAKQEIEAAIKTKLKSSDLKKATQILRNVVKLANGRGGAQSARLSRDCVRVLLDVRASILLFFSFFGFCERHHFSLRAPSISP